MAHETIRASVGDGTRRTALDRPGDPRRQPPAALRGATVWGLVTSTRSGDPASAAGADADEPRYRKMLYAPSSTAQDPYEEAEGHEKLTPAASNGYANGYASGGGCELAVACDVGTAPENTRPGLPETAPRRGDGRRRG